MKDLITLIKLCWRDTLLVLLLLGSAILTVFATEWLSDYFNRRNTPQYVEAATDSLRLPDSTMVISQQVVTDADALKSQKKSIKALGIRPKSVVISQNTSVESRLSVGVKTDTIVEHDTVFIRPAVEYSDRWNDITLRDTMLSITTRDSLTTYVSKIHKHRFLWWRWGTKGYNVTIHNHNPHSRITYNKTIIDNVR